jgi:hypothetical protein
MKMSPRALITVLSKAVTDVTFYMITTVTVTAVMYLGKFMFFFSKWLLPAIWNDMSSDLPFYPFLHNTFRLSTCPKFCLCNIFDLKLQQHYEWYIYIYIYIQRHTQTQTNTHTHKRNTGTTHIMYQNFKSGWFKISSYCWRTQLRHSTMKPFYRHYT